MTRKFQLHHTCAFCGRPYLLNTGTFTCECGARIHRGRVMQTVHIMEKHPVPNVITQTEVS